MEIEIQRNYNVLRLQRWLEYELSTSMLFILYHFVGIALLLMTVAAILFTPFMMWVLFQEKRYGWIASFIIAVMLPVIGVFFIDSKVAWKTIAGLLPLAFFYFYCFCLRLTIRDWED